MPAAARRLPVLLGVVCLLLGLALPAGAGEVVDTVFAAPDVDIAPKLYFYESPSAEVQIERPSDASGQKPMMLLRARGSAPLHRWAVVNLSNSGPLASDLVLEVPHQKFAGSGVWRPRAEGSLVGNIQAAGPPRVAPLAMAGSDAYRLSLPPGQSLTLAMELAGNQPDVVRLWHGTAFEQRSANLKFFQGATIGIAGLLALAVLCLFILRPAGVLAAAALFIWPATIFLVAEFGYMPDMSGLFATSPDMAAKVRVFIEALMLAGLIAVFITFTGLRRRLPLAGLTGMALVAAAGALAVYGWYAPQIAAGAVRLSFAGGIVAGLMMLGILADRRARRVRTTLMAWLPLTLWMLAAGLAALGMATSEIFSLALAAGLVLVMLAMAMVAARFAFSDLGGPHRDRAETSRRVLALSSAGQSVWEWLPDSASLYVGPELERALGLEPRRLCGAAEAWIEQIHPDDRAGYDAAIESAVIRGRGSFDHEFRLRRADGTFRWYQLRARALDSEETGERRLIGTLGDVTAWRRSEDRILSDAVRDRVTGLPNRALLIDRLERAMRSAGTDGHRNLYVLAIDLDRFKSVNDGLGHEVGDSLLNIIGRRLSRRIGPEDTLARLPGDQFAIIFNGNAPPRDIVDFAEAVRRDISEPVSLRPREIFITATIGVAGLDDLAQTPDDFLRQAEIALFEAKRRGKDTIEFFSPKMLHERSHLILLEQDLHRAMQRGEIEVVYQPIMRLADGELAGFEALMRWHHPHHGLLEPGVFVGLAEETGIIRELGRFVLDEALRQLGVWKRAFRPPESLFVSVNVSFAQLLNYELVDAVRGLLAREGISASALKLEITESLMMENPELTGRVVDRLHELGVTLACDDFGTGYSSLANLHRLPFDTLKIDRTLIDASDSDQRAGVVLDATVAMAHGLGLSIVAEGVETDAQMRRLMALGCDLVQGYLVGHPVTARQIADAFGGVSYALGKGEGGFAGFWRRLMGNGDLGDVRHPAHPDALSSAPAVAYINPETAAADEGEVLEPWAPPDHDVSLPDLEARTQVESAEQAGPAEAGEDEPIDLTGFLGAHSHADIPAAEEEVFAPAADAPQHAGGNGDGRSADAGTTLAGDGDGAEADGMLTAADEEAGEPVGKPVVGGDRLVQRLRRRTRGSRDIM